MTDRFFTRSGESPNTRISSPAIQSMRNGQFPEGTSRPSVGRVSNGIRRKETRGATLTVPVDQLPAEDRQRFQEIQERIDFLEREQRGAAGMFSGPSRRLERSQELADLRLESARLRTVTFNGLDITVDTDSSEVDDNPLNDFVDVQYHVSLTMISEKQVLELQQNGFNQSGGHIDIDTLKSDQREDQSVTIASTAEVFRNNSISSPSSVEGAPSATINTTRNYYNITSLVTKNIMEPSETNPLISTMLNMKMRIAEPHGFKLHEDIRDTAEALGYTEINPGRILYRVDIYFSGYNQNTGQWVEQIDMSNGRGIKIISSYMGISSMEAEVTSSGTMYDVDLVPAGHHAYRPEDFVLEAETIDSGETFRDFLQNFSTALKESKEQRVSHQLLRNYEFFAPQALLESSFDIDEFKNQFRFLFEGASQHAISSGRDVDIMTVLRGALANTKIVQDLFIAEENNENFTIPRVHFGIRFNTLYGNTNGEKFVDPLLNDYKEITHQYIIEPYITFRHGTVKRDTMNQYVNPESQLERIKEIIRFGMLRRIYNYIYTGENTEVIDFDVKLKAFYYETLNVTQNNQGGPGRHGDSTSSSQSITRQSIIGDRLRLEGEGPNSPQNVDRAVRRIFGQRAQPQANPRKGADRLGGGFNESPDVRFYGDIVSPPDGPRSDYETYLRDYLTLDFLKLDDLQIRGDPTWLLNPYSNYDMDSLREINTTEGVAAITPGTTLKVKPRTGQIIFLRLFAPEQDDYMNPSREKASSYPNIIGGFYQVLSVTSTFENGRFTQSIDGTKLNHLNYAEELFERSASKRQGSSPAPGNIHREPPRTTDTRNLAEAVEEYRRANPSSTVGRGGIIEGGAAAAAGIVTGENDDDD